MNGNISLLSNAKLSDVKTDPFPHIIIRDPVPVELADELIHTYPLISTLTKGEPYGSNKRYDYTLKDIRERHNVPEIWSEFIEAQAGDEFVQKFFELFGPHIEKIFPDVSAQMKPWGKIQKGIRAVDSFEDKDILVDAHISINTPVVGTPNSVRKSHVDDPMKLYSGLFYLRPDGDDSKGGDLELYRFKSRKYKMFGQHVFSKFVEKVATIPYEKNVLILFLNTPYSLHGVTVRQKTDKARYFVNLVGEVEKPLFDISHRQESLLMRRFHSYFLR